MIIIKIVLEVCQNPFELSANARICLFLHFIKVFSNLNRTSCTIVSVLIDNKKNTRGHIENYKYGQ